MDGIISSVTTRDLGAQIVEPAAAGATILTLEHVADFADEGGQLQVSRPDETLATLAYTTIDRDECTVTLAAPLTFAVDDEDFAAVYPPASVQIATVIVDEEEAPDDVDMIEAVVPYVMRAMLADGIRDDPDMAEQVVVDIVADEYTLVDLRYQQPVIELDNLPPTVAPPVPAPVEDLTVTASLYVDGWGFTHIALTATCSPVTTDVDGEPFTPAGYELWGQPAGQEYRRITASASAVITHRPFVAGSVWAFKARAFGAVPGDFSPEVEVALPVDNTPPDAPSKPILASKGNFLTIVWDGLTAAAAAMPADYQAVRIHLSTVDGFLPAASNEKALITSIRGGMVTLSDLEYEVSYYVRLVAIDKNGNASAPSEQATITTGRLTDYDIASMSVAKLTAGVLQADAWIKAGDATGFHSMMDASGFSVWRPDPEGGDPIKSGHFGTGQADFLEWAGPDGDIRAAVDENGRATFQGLSIPERRDGYELTVYGTEFSAWFGQGARGVVTRSSISSNSAEVATESVVMEIRSILLPDRLYKICVEPHHVDGSAAVPIELKLRIAYDGAPVGTSSTLISHTRVVMTSTLASSSPGCFAFIPTDGQLQDEREIRIAYTVETTSPGATSWVDATPTHPCTIYLEDVGPAVAETNAITNWTSVWTATNTRAFAASGSARTDSTYLGYSHAPMVVGMCDGTPNYSLAIFTGNATSGEKTKTLATALSGATLMKAEVYLYNQWSKISQLPVDVRANTLTSIANTAPSGPAVRTIIPEASGRWVDITTLWTGASRGIWIGPTGSDHIYHGHIRSHVATSDNPKLRITYRR